VLAPLDLFGLQNFESMRDNKPLSRILRKFLPEYKTMQCISKAVTINIMSGEASLKTCPFCSLQLCTVQIGGRERLACANCDFVHWNNPKPVAATVIPLDGGIVLVKRKFPPFVDDWCLPGGFIEAMEHPAEAAAREAFEETGLEVRVSRLFDAGAPGRGINIIILFYEALPTGGKLKAGDDASEVRCFKQHELPTNIAFDLHRQTIHKWFEYQPERANI
jgi:8-oxo-dGTP diphosphatase